MASKRKRPVKPTAVSYTHLVEGKDGKKAPQRTQHNEMSNRKIAEEIAIIQAWIEQNRGCLLYTSRCV